MSWRCSLHDVERQGLQCLSQVITGNPYKSLLAELLKQGVQQEMREAIQEHLGRDELASERTLLATERTFSAWIRTGLAGVGGGLAVARAHIQKL